jgi:hypothetical protein
VKFEGYNFGTGNPVVNELVFYSKGCLSDAPVLPFKLKGSMDFEAAVKKLQKVFKKNSSSFFYDNTYEVYINKVNSKKFSLNIKLTDDAKSNRKQEDKASFDLVYKFENSENKNKYLFNRASKNMLYVGDIVNGKCLTGNCNSGEGEIQWEDGRNFNGSFGNGMPRKGKVTLNHPFHGSCTFEKTDLDDGLNKSVDTKINCADGVKLSAKYEFGIPVFGSDLKNGQGEVYEGQINPHKFSPFQIGELTLINGRSIRGRFNSWDLPKNSTVNYENGNSYYGEITRDGTREGKGTLTDISQGVVIIGNFSNDKVVGEVTLRYSDIEGFEQKGDYSEINGFYGMVRSTYPHSLGHLIFEGEFKDNMPTGTHVMTSSNYPDTLSTSNYSSPGILASGSNFYSKEFLKQSSIDFVAQYYAIVFKNEMEKFVNELKEKGRDIISQQVKMSSEYKYLFEFNLKKGDAFVDIDSYYAIGFVDISKNLPETDFILRTEPDYSQKGFSTPDLKIYDESRNIYFSNAFKFPKEFTEIEKVYILPRATDYPKEPFPVYVFLIKYAK